MTILQCEACGAPLPVKGRTKTYTCEYCGTSQTITLPVTNKKADTMYNRALRYMKDYEDEYTYKKKKEKELKVKEYTNKIIDEFPDYAKAYVLLLMLKTRVYKEEELGDLTDDLSYYDAYQVIMEKGDPELKKRIRSYYLKALQPYILRQIDYADKIEEMKTICWFCGKKAIMNLRFHNGEPVYEGEQIQMGGNESYYPVCRKHYYNPPIK